MKRMSKAFPELDRDCWLREGRNPTIRDIAEHCRRINETDSEIPVNDNGRFMDGGYRLVRALNEGAKTGKAVRYVVMPDPYEVEDL